MFFIFWRLFATEVMADSGAVYSKHTNFPLAQVQQPLVLLSMLPPVPLLAAWRLGVNIFLHSFALNWR